MKTIAKFVRTTIVGGLFFLAPIVVLIVILAKVFDYAKKGLNAVLVHLPPASDLGAGAATLLAVVLVALICFVAGLVARSVSAQRVVNALEFFSAVEDSRLRLSEAGERKRAWRRRDRGTPRGLRTHGRGMATRRSNRSAEQRSYIGLRSRRTEPAFRVGFLLFGGHSSPCRRQDGGCAQLPQAVRRGRILARRQLAGGYTELIGVSITVDLTVWEILITIRSPRPWERLLFTQPGRPRRRLRTIATRPSRCSAGALMDARYRAVRRTPRPQGNDSCGADSNPSRGDPGGPALAVVCGAPRESRLGALRRRRLCAQESSQGPPIRAPPFGRQGCGSVRPKRPSSASRPARHR